MLRSLHLIEAESIIAKKKKRRPTPGQIYIKTNLVPITADFPRISL